MLFLLQSADGAATSTTSGEQLGSLTLPQFRAAMATAKVRGAVGRVGRGGVRSFESQVHHGGQGCKYQPDLNQIKPRGRGGNGGWHCQPPSHKPGAREGGWGLAMWLCGGGGCEGAHSVPKAGMVRRQHSGMRVCYRPFGRPLHTLMVWLTSTHPSTPPPPEQVITPRFPPEKVDEIFTGVATAETTLARKVGPEGEPTRGEEARGEEAREEEARGEEARGEPTRGEEAREEEARGEEARGEETRGQEAETGSRLEGAARHLP